MSGYGTLRTKGVFESLPLSVKSDSCGWSYKRGDRFSLQQKRYGIALRGALANRGCRGNCSVLGLVCYRERPREKLRSMYVAQEG